MVDKKELIELDAQLTKIHARLLEIESDPDFKNIKFNFDGYSESATLIISVWTSRTSLFLRRLSAIIKEVPSKRKRNKK